MSRVFCQIFSPTGGTAGVGVKNPKAGELGGHWLQSENFTLTRREGLGGRGLNSLLFLGNSPLSATYGGGHDEPFRGGGWTRHSSLGLFSGTPPASRGKPGWFDRHPRSLGRRRCGMPETRENLVSQKKLCYRAGQKGFPGPQGPGRPGKPNLVLMNQRQGTPR
jgi:hypothetical protein